MIVKDRIEERRKLRKMMIEFIYSFIKFVNNIKTKKSTQ